MSWAADFLVIGGATDVSLHRLARVARGLGVDTGWIEYSRPGRAITYQPESNALSIDGVALAPKAVFYRMEYFVSGRVRTPAFHERSFASYALIDAWASAAAFSRSL